VIVRECQCSIWHDGIETGVLVEWVVSRWVLCICLGVAVGSDWVCHSCCGMGMPIGLGLSYFGSFGVVQLYFGSVPFCPGCFLDWH